MAGTKPNLIIKIAILLTGLLFISAAGADVRRDFRQCERTVFKKLHKDRNYVARDSFEQYCIGLSFTAGSFGKKDFRRAVQWFRKAADAGHDGAQMVLGYHYEKGLGVDQDAKQAVQWYRRAAAVGNAEAMLALGNAYRNGIGVEPDENEARRWIATSAARGNKRAQKLLNAPARRKRQAPATQTARGIKLFRQQNYRESFRILLTEAKRGDPRAQAYIGLHYEEGTGVTKNAQQAFHWYRAAARQGHAGAQKAVGQLYEDGRGVRENWTEAARWYQASARAGNREGQVALARAYRFGIGVPQNRQMAIQWFQKAGEKGLNAARFQANELIQGRCIGTRNKLEDSHFTGMCNEPAGRLFRSSGQRWAWLQEMHHIVVSAELRARVKINCESRGGRWIADRCSEP